MLFVNKHPEDKLHAFILGTYFLSNGFWFELQQQLPLAKYKGLAMKY